MTVCRKFRKKLTSVRRRSAFVIFQAIKPLLNATKLLTADSSKATLSKPLLAAADSQSSDTYEANTSPDDTNGRSQRTAKTVQTRKTSKCCDSMKTRSNREKLLQEKEDFQLAKMLQECVGTTDAPSRYSLRSRNKSSVSSLSSSTSSSQDLFHGKGCTTVNATSKYKKSMPFADNTKDLVVVRSSQRNDTNNDKFIDFSFQKLTRSRRIAMTMSGV